MKKDAKSIGFYSWLPSLAPEGQLEYRHADDVLTELSNIARLIPAWREGRQLERLEALIAPLRTRYGSPCHPDQNDDPVWLALATKVATHLQAANDLRINGLELMVQQLSDRHALLSPVWDSHAARRAYRKLGPLAVARIDPIRPHDEIEAREYAELGLLLTATEQADTPQSFKRIVGDQLFAAFSGMVAGPGVTGSRLIPTPTGTVVETSLGIWATYLLSRMWHGGADVRPCDGCGALFLPGRKGRVYCRKTCADRAYRRRNAAP